MHCAVLLLELLMRCAVVAGLGWAGLGYAVLSCAPHLAHYSNASPARTVTAQTVQHHGTIHLLLCRASQYLSDITGLVVKQRADEGVLRAALQD